MINAERRKQEKPSVRVDQSNRINWIERLLQTPLRDYRKYCIWRIFVPYLLNVRRLSEQEATDIIKDWLSRCNQRRRLDFNYKQKIKDGIEGAKEGYLPISREKLRNENSRLYFLLQHITNY